MRRDFRRAIRAWKPPSPQRLITAAALPNRSAAASFGVAGSVAAALARLDLDVGPRVLLIIDRRSDGVPGPRVAHAAATALGQFGAVTIGLAPDLSATDTRRWHTLARTLGTDTTVLGTSGWNRVVFGDRSLVLEHADFPTELHGEMTVVALSAPSGSGCVGLWTELVHQNTALRVRVALNGVAELSCAVDARYLLIGQIGTAWLTALATPAITAELVARGIERLREQLKGVESAGPWEDAGVQHLSELSDAGRTATDLVVRVGLEDNTGAELARRLSEMLGWRLERVDDHVGGTGGEG